MIIPNSISKDYKQDATNFLKEQFDNPVGFIPKGYYYYTDSMVMHGAKGHDLTGCYFYTDKNTTFLKIRGERGVFKGFPIIDVLDVKELSGKAIIKLQHYSEHLQHLTLEAQIISDYPQVINGGFKGVVLDGITKFDTDYGNNRRVNCESHWNTIRLKTKRLKSAFEGIRTNGSISSFNEISISDFGSSRVFKAKDFKSNSDIRLFIQAMHSLEEHEKDKAAVLLEGGENTLFIKSSDFKGKKHSEKHPVWSPHYVVENNAQRNSFFHNWSMEWAVKYGKTKGENPIIWNGEI